MMQWWVKQRAVECLERISSASDIYILIEIRKWIYTVQIYRPIYKIQSQGNLAITNTSRAFVEIRRCEMNSSFSDNRIFWFYVYLIFERLIVCSYFLSNNIAEGIIIRSLSYYEWIDFLKPKICVASTNVQQRAVVLKERMVQSSLKRIRFLTDGWICCRLRLRLYLFCEGRISVLKRRFKTPIQNAVNSGYCSSSSEPERRLYDVI